MRDNEKTWTAKRNMILIFKSDQRILVAASKYSVGEMTRLQSAGGTMDTSVA
jgi:hypothetical protein